MRALIDVVRERVNMKKIGKDWFGCCPFHSEKTPSFTVSPSKGMYYCFGCGAGGDAIQFLRDLDGLSYVDAVKALGGTLERRTTRQRIAHDAARANEQRRRDNWRWFAGVVFESVLDLEEHWVKGDQRVKTWAEGMEPDTRRLHAKALRRSNGENLPLTLRERAAVNFVCSAERVDRDRVRQMYGL